MVAGAHSLLRGLSLRFANIHILDSPSRSSVFLVAAFMSYLYDEVTICLHLVL